MSCPSYKTTRWKEKGALLHNSGRHQQFSLRPTESVYAHGLGHAQLGHAIEHCAFYPCFRALGRQAPRPEPNPRRLVVLSKECWRANINRQYAELTELFCATS